MLLISYKTILVEHAKHLSIKQLMTSLRLLMKHTTCCKKKYGTAIGAPPAAHRYTKKIALYEIVILSDMISIQLRLDKIFADDKIGLWKVLPNGRTCN